MKDIKDYLHLYLGCECMWRVLGDNEWKPGGVDLKVLDRLYDRQPFEVKPILRPLSDMTEDEKADLDNIAIRYSDGVDSLSVRCFGIAELTKYLLSQHFDLFGLIEAGLAIDKTKLNA